MASEELELWYGLTETSQEGPWYFAKHFSVVLTWTASDASAIAWGRVLRFASLVFQAGADFGPKGVGCNIYVKKSAHCTNYYKHSVERSPTDSRIHRWAQM